MAKPPQLASAAAEHAAGKAARSPRARLRPEMTATTEMMTATTTTTATMTTRLPGPIRNFPTGSARAG